MIFGSSKTCLPSSPKKHPAFPAAQRHATSTSWTLDVAKGSVAWPCALHLHCCERMVPDLVTYGAVMSCCRLTWRWALRLLGYLMMERIEAVAWNGMMVDGMGWLVEMLSFWSRGFRVEDVTVCACETDFRWRNFTVPTEVGFCTVWFLVGQMPSRPGIDFTSWPFLSLEFRSDHSSICTMAISFRVRMWFASVQPSVHVKQQLNGSMPWTSCSSCCKRSCFQTRWFSMPWPVHVKLDLMLPPNSKSEPQTGGFHFKVGSGPVKSMFDQ